MKVDWNTNKIKLRLRECCGQPALEIQDPGKPLLLYCPTCGRTWDPFEQDPELTNTLTYFKVLLKSLEKVFPNRMSR
jgi:hypothetical protein